MHMPYQRILRDFPNCLTTFPILFIQQLLDHVLAHTAQFWSKNFISELILNVGTWDQSAPTPYLDQIILVEKYHSTKKRLLMFDYDVSSQYICCIEPINVASYSSCYFPSL